MRIIREMLAFNKNLDTAPDALFSPIRMTRSAPTLPSLASPPVLLALDKARQGLAREESLQVRHGELPQRLK